MSCAVDERIRGWNVRTLCVPLPVPHRTSSGVITKSPLVLTDLITDSGVVGRSLLFTYTEAALKPTADLVGNIGQLITGEVLAPVAIQEKLSARFRLLGAEGLIGMALAAIDMANWDALARCCNLPLVRLLGGADRPLLAYAGIGFDGPVDCAKQAEAFFKRGFRAVKAKVGYPSLKEDLAVVRALRSAVGDDAEIMVDYNQSLTPAEAIQRLRTLDDEGLTWIEEPTSAHDHEGHASIAREAKTPIQCGENWWGPEEVRAAIAAKASDYLMFDVMKIGGVTGWLRAAAMAQSHDLLVANHLWPELSARLLCLSPTARWLEYIDWWNPILREPLEISDGLVRVNDTPGSGLDWDEKMIERLLASS
jgi:mandelate racemase